MLNFAVCPNPPIVPNGQVLGNQRYIGARISHLCGVNYVIDGSPSLKCNNDGQWKPDGTQGTGDRPQCIRGKDFLGHNLIFSNVYSF